MDSINTVNGIFRKYGDRYRAENPFLSVHEKKVMRAIELCRTEALGGRIEVCDKCGHTVRLYNSCRNRHCPQCQFMKKEKWIADKKNEIFPFKYFHVVFTLPDKLNPIVFRNKKLLYDNLFNKVKDTLLSISDEKKYFEAKIGFFSILHTWGQKLNMHPHLHCVVPGGGYCEKEGKWKSCRENYLLPVEVVKKRFRSLFLLELKSMYMCEFLPVNDLIENPWNKTNTYFGFVQLEVYLNGVPLRYTPKRYGLDCPVVPGHR